MCHCHGFACLVRLGTDSQTCLSTWLGMYFVDYMVKSTHSRPSAPAPPSGTNLTARALAQRSTVSLIPTSPPSEDCKGMAGFYLLSTACEVSNAALILQASVSPTTPHHLQILCSHARPAVVKPAGRRVGLNCTRCERARRQVLLPQPRRMHALFVPLALRRSGNYRFPY